MSGCPVDHSAASKGGCPVDHSASGRSASACPVSDETIKQMMGPSCSSDDLGASLPSQVGDLFPDSTPQPGQRIALETVPRFKSGIPKSNPDDENAEWTFPSQQRMYNALKRKKWVVPEESIPAFLHVHNNVNVASWRKVMAYESLHLHKCPNPKLKSFKGTPGEETMKARWNVQVRGFSAPYDTHHWIVDRCGEEVEYIIDFYDGNPNAVVASTKPNATAEDIKKAPVTTYLDVRPAPTLWGLLDTVRVYFGI